jgi:hypothetical protein
MKNASTKDLCGSNPDQRTYTPGQLPKRTNTVLANVLARLLRGGELTGMSSVFAEYTTRLAAVIFALENDYHWQIDRRDVDVATTDGRVATIVAYRLPREATISSISGFTDDWVEQVEADRAMLRLGAAAAKNAAMKLNVSGKKMRVCDPRQMDLEL